MPVVLALQMFTMDGERKINIGEGVPLNAAGAANIFLNTRNSKAKSRDEDGTVIRLNTEKSTDVGVHINTTLSIASSKKIKLLFVINFLLSIVCMVISCSIAFYYWNEMVSMRRQLDTMNNQFLIHNLNNQKLEPSPYVVGNRPNFKGIDLREPRMESGAKLALSPTARRYFVEDLGDDMVLLDSSKKSSSTEKVPVYDLSVLRKDPLIAHFSGALREHNIGTQSIIGPWVRDTEVSTKNSHTKIELNNNNYVTIQEDGLYLVYAQIVYLTHAPNCYFIWARQPAQEPRLVSTCATGDDSSSRPLDKSQISCSVQTVAKLLKGDTVNIAQREPNRTLWLRPGYSYFGFVKLSS